MLVKCDQCQAKYKLTIKAKPGKPVTFRCGKCKHLIEISAERIAAEAGPTPETAAPLPPESKPAPKAAPGAETVKVNCLKCGNPFIKPAEDKNPICHQCRIDSLVGKIKEKYGVSVLPPREPSSEDARRYTIRSADGLVLGPIKLRSIKVLAREKRLKGVEEVSVDGGEYQPLLRYHELAELFPDLKEILDTSGLEDKVDEAFMAAFGKEEAAGPPPAPAIPSAPEPPPETPAPPAPEPAPEPEPETSAPAPEPEPTAPPEPEPASAPEPPDQPPDSAVSPEEPPPPEPPPPEEIEAEAGPAPSAPPPPEPKSPEPEPPPAAPESPPAPEPELSEPPPAPAEPESPPAPEPEPKPAATEKVMEVESSFSMEDEPEKTETAPAPPPAPAQEKESLPAKPPAAPAPPPPPPPPAHVPAEAVGTEFDLGEDAEAADQEEEEVIEDLEPLPEPPPDARYRIRYPDGLMLGPVKLGTIKELFAGGNLTGQEEVQRENDPWVAFAELPELAELVGEADVIHDDEILELTDVLEEKG